MPSAAADGTRRPVIVASSGRCGSTLLSDMMRLHPELLSLSEFFLVMQPDPFPGGPVSGRQFWLTLSRPRRWWTLMLRLDIAIEEILYEAAPPARFGPRSGVPPLLLVPLPHLTGEHEAVFDELAAWVPRLEPAPIGEQYRRLFGWLCLRFGRQLWIERSGSSAGWLASLMTSFPEALVIHLYRDGRDCAISMSRHRGFKLNFVSRQLYRRLGVDPFTSEDPLLVEPPPALRPFMPDTFDRERFAALRVPVEEMGRTWSAMVLQCWRQLGRLAPSQVTHLRYETLVADPEGELRRLAQFIGVREDEVWLRRASALARPRPPRWPALPAAERRRLVDACAPGMQLLYGRTAELVGPEPEPNRGCVPTRG